MAKTAKRRQKVQMPAGIRNKMMAAVSMLMVSAIMMVSSTYAWFTLSTAPEVTGITTNVGANGNLEMMLLNDTTYANTQDPNLGVESEIGDSMAAANANVLESNETWGNLVDLSSSSYGLSSIMLLPAKLNVATTASSSTINASPLLAPSYGNDGRVIAVDQLTYTGEYDSGAWTVNDMHAGVRALGTSSGTTVRLSIYRTALSTAKTAVTDAKTTAENSLDANAQQLATLLVDKVQGATSFSSTYKTTLKSIIDGVTKANGYVETAIKNAALAYRISETIGDDAELTDDAVKALKTDIDAVTDLTKLAEVAGVDLPESIDNAISTYLATNADLKNAADAYGTIEEKSGDLSWEEVNNVLQPLVDQDYMSINEVNVKGASKEAILGAVVPDGINMSEVNVRIVMFGDETGDAGVYYKLAQVCGQYVVSGDVKVNYNGFNTAAPFTMTQNVDSNSVYMTVALSEINTAGAPEASVGGEGTTVALNDTLGYMLDFGFRTNAAGSSLLLQTAEAQRVYNSAGSTSTATSTQGGGSYMQFTSTNIKTFSIEEMLALMGAIRVAFVQPNIDDTGSSNYTLLAMGKLNTETETEEDGSISYLGGSATEDTLKLDLNLYNYTVENGYITLDTKLDSQTITSLTQNTAAKVSVIVYLDGEIVDNTMVANAAQSMYGSLNLQFSSTATLVPMDNNGMFGGGATIVSPDVEFTQWKVAGETGSIGDYEGKVLPGVILYNGTDGEIYYSINGGPKYLLTTSNYMYALDVQLNTGSGTQTTMTLSQSTLNLTVGDAATTLTVNGAPEDATIEWKSANSEIASVDQNGAVTAVAAGGPVDISATVNGTTVLTCVVTVNAAGTP